MMVTSSIRWAGRTIALAITMRPSKTSNVPWSSSRRIRRSTITSATPIGGWGAPWKRTSNGRMPRISTRTRKICRRSRPSSKTDFRPTRLPRLRLKSRVPRPMSTSRKNPVTAAETHSAVEIVDTAPAKVNLTLRVLGRRADGYHEIESLVAFADLCDRLSYAPDNQLKLNVTGPSAGQAGEDGENLVLKAARILAARIPALTLGAFRLQKSLPVAAGLGGGSSDAAAALRLL